MNNHGFVRVAAASPKLKVADCKYNTQEILATIDNAKNENVSILVFPEMCITAYTCADLFHQRYLLDQSEEALQIICDHLKDKNMLTLVGMPIEIENKLYNAAIVIYAGNIVGIVPKTYLPNYSEFYDKRWFTSSSELKQNHVYLLGQDVVISTDLIFETVDFSFAIEICEDLWAPIPPSSYHALHGADLIFNLSASPENVGKHTYRKNLILQQSARCMAGYVYASAGCGESSTDLVFGGGCLIAENGTLLNESKRFSLENQLIISDVDVEKLRSKRLKNSSFSLLGNHTKEIDYMRLKIEHIAPQQTKLCCKVDPMPFVPKGELLNERCSDIFQIQTTGLAKRILHTNCQTAIIGVSGGLDSTLALLVLVACFDRLHISRKNIYGITMPGFGTTDRTYSNAIELMKRLDITTKEISIVDAVNQHFKDIEQDASVHDITYENSQARERTQILMDYANKVNGLVIGTGDLSESALGWCTYNGDHMSMYAVNSGVPKTLVKALVSWVATTQDNEDVKLILKDILETPVSPELLPAIDGQISQITENYVGPYILHDFFLYNFLSFGFSPQKIYFLAQIAFENNYSKDDISKWLGVFYKRFFSQQFKRSCMPDGPKVGSINLSPRGDWRMPSDANLWTIKFDK